jgi:hypothetical protein
MQNLRVFQQTQPCPATHVWSFAGWTPCWKSGSLALEHGTFSAHTIRAHTLK